MSEGAVDVGIDESSIARRRDDVAAVTVSGEVVIHDRARLFHLDPIATIVWECCDGTVSVGGLASELATTFDVDAATARRDVLTAVRALAADGLLAGIPQTGAGGVEPMPASTLGCVGNEPDGELEVRFDVGGSLVGVSTDHAGARDALRTILGAHTTHRGGEPVAAYALALAPAGPDGAPRSPHTLYDLDGPMLESDDPQRVLRALFATLATHGDLAAVGVGALPAIVVGREGHAAVVARAPDPALDRVALARHGLAIAEAPVAFVDCSAGVVVGAPGLEIDVDALERFAATLPSRADAMSPALEWGRCSIAALATDVPGDAAHALLRLGPVADDDVPAVSGADVALDALLGLLTTVPIVATGADVLSGAIPTPGR